MFSRILIAVDGSIFAKKAFESSIFLSKKCNSKLDIVHVIPCESGGDSAATFELIGELMTKGEEMLEECKKEPNLTQNLPFVTVSDKTGIDLRLKCQLIIFLTNRSQ